jgi:hypothetical protein
MIDAVLSPHSPLTCGTAKWSQQLAKRLGVPFGRFRDLDRYYHPLISTRLSEVIECEPDTAYDLFVHDFLDDWRSLILIRRATAVYAANRELAARLRSIRPDVITAWCPSSLDGNRQRSGYRVLTFGMAHKIARSHYERLKAQLEAEHPDYIICWTCAVHEGRPWEQEFSRAEATLRGIFGDRLRVLGSLADDGLAKELHDCDAVALFFEHGVRENNTTAWAAVEAGKPLYTNRDEHSPDLDVTKYSWDALLRAFMVSART